MGKPFPIHIGLQGGIKQLRIEKILCNPFIDSFGDEDGEYDWIIWLSANADFTLGTFIRLGHDGSINRVTVHADGTESVFNLISVDATSHGDE